VKERKATTMMSKSDAKVLARMAEAALKPYSNPEVTVRRHSNYGRYWIVDVKVPDVDLGSRGCVSGTDSAFMEIEDMVRMVKEAYEAEEEKA
jgi:hypothetical protein